ncbi:MAG TPA: SIS domain-containing protein [Gemmatimonadales bacterium]|nr:SIS domain-containing protein [Gemmatimonadales bacterium]
MNPTERVRADLEALAALVKQVALEHADDIARLAARFARTLSQGGTLFFAGNGGSAADAQHIAAEYVVRYKRDRRALPAVALTTDTSILTAGGNDLGFDEIFSRQVDALAGPGDLLVLHSTSGESANVIRAARAAKAKGAGVVALLGKGGGQLRPLVDDALVVPAAETARIQELHLAAEHVICELVERELGL